MSKSSLSNAEKATLAQRNPQNFTLLNKQGLNNMLSDSNSDMERASYKKLAQLELEKARLQATLAAKNKINDTLLQEGGLSKALDRAVNKISDKKELNRLSKEHSHRVVILIVTAAVFDLIQLSLTPVLFIPVAGVLLSAIINKIISGVAFFTFFFFWRHYDISYIERKWGGTKAVLGLKILSVFTSVASLILETISLYPGILLNTVISILVIRSIDKKREQEAKLAKIQEQIERQKTMLARQAAWGS